jgi:uracil phosphoribosyltransferase
MLATGGSLSSAVESIKKAGGEQINVICILASPEGISRLTADHPDVDIFCARIDEGLDGNGYILPGLGDCGDRLYGTE